MSDRFSPAAPDDDDPVAALSDGRDAGARRQCRDLRRGRGLFRWRFPLHRWPRAKYGKHRVFDTPISESGIAGAAIGMGAYGLRPVAEIQFADYIYPAYDQIVSEAARLRYRSCGMFTAPIVFRTPCGGGIYGGQTHSQSPEAIFTHVAGLRTVMPSNPYDAKGLLISSIECDDLVIFLLGAVQRPFDGYHDRPVTSQHPDNPCRRLQRAAGQGRDRARRR